MTAKWQWWLWLYKTILIKEFKNTCINRYSNGNFYAKHKYKDKSYDFAKTTTKKIPKDYPVFMAIAETCGHDRRGNAKDEDDIQDITQQFKKWLSENINIK